MDSFHKAYPDKLVNQQPQYVFKSQAYNKDMAIELPNTGSDAYIDYPENADWIHSSVPKTTIDVNTQNQISGKIATSSTDEYKSYGVNLTLNDEIIATNIPVSKDGSWGFDGTPYNLKSGDILRAQVTGKRSNGDIAYSAWSIKQLGGDVPYDQWTVNPPVLVQPVDGDTSITLDLPDQNCQLDRSYDSVVSVNGKEVAKYSYNGLKAERGILLTDITLKKNDLVSVKIVGHQPDKADKESTITQLVVAPNSDHPYDTWKVLPTTVSGVKSGDTSVSISVPSQDAYNNRSYSMNTYVNDKLVNTKNIALSGGKYDVPYTDDQGSIKPFKVNDKIKVVVVGHQPDQADKLSEASETTVKDGTDYNTWKVSSPKVKDNLYSDDKVLTISVPTEDQNYKRSYMLQILVDGKVLKTINVNQFNADMNATLDKGLETNQKITAVLIGHQPDRTDKKSELSNEVIVKDSNANWKIDKPSIVPMTDKDKNVSITAPALSNNNGRSYEAIVSVNGIEKAKQTIDSEQKLQIPLTAKKGDTISAYIIGHQSGHDDKKGDVSEITVSHKSAQTHTAFKRVYWQNYGYVYEGLVNNSDVNMSDPSKLKETINVIDATGKTVKQVSATPTDWYGNKSYNGFQFIIDNEILSALKDGNYSFQISLNSDGVDYGTSDLNITSGFGSGRYHDNYADLEQVDINSKIISPLIESNKPEITVSTPSSSEKVHVVNKYWNDSTQLVFDGYVGDPSNENNPTVTKKLEIRDKSGNIVYQKDNLATIDTSWGANMGVPKQDTFQAIVPYEYSIQSNYKYTLIVRDSSGKTVSTEELK
ncbi:hypothetical protein [Lactococcus lactis]|uniref:hypothetical protein n=1 Tax=Lactococcus lactis TaxID=1358 RepID=UPI0019129841|nr:hypothetical protein [Lactococcus lactis]WDA67259.1 hypothetical protein IL310_00400 [Lactococcus lactis]